MPDLYVGPIFVDITVICDITQVTKRIPFLSIVVITLCMLSRMRLLYVWLYNRQVTILILPT